MTCDMKPVLEALTSAPVVPVLTVSDVRHAAPLAQALYKGGVKFVEVTLRTDAALEVISEMKAAQPELIVGAGTILTPADLDATLKAGSEFSVSPGCTPKLAAALIESGVPAFPGIATASEALQRMEEGFEVVKFFPAEKIGGASALKALVAPLQNLKVMPTGGVSPSNMMTYLAIPNVVAVGGGWLVSDAALANNDWDGIEATAQEAMKIANN
ncbi:2-dehydro-3-deoxyphosphogluconate aldolase/4-hydroxy-2-oxoglutarate aldolase [Hirschia baltica ATCC 49814]|uniref:2-dehydro-3-deoxy-phosphogluconate aldolase n=2 Tax=Hirschia TaxID=2723 RepID=C6XJD7_HIRBI|nr:2-dehydro-3-deoxyphosphogluconate aldolase/4-hydroxy-2-oxoglutarate aldolase [Hirschia baltica ATCC 49814]